ncbi:hypothetical protein [Cyclobacterium amurskyense]|uniref:Uncharacterized protein n=1 Tax=Cyclobacterium amurskyense TaxID=320787 RepID=A0A0H4PA94_9BACT|nr:hypothetical protein [Cyclobacterium amurskyense]AKP51124.1 hypothetical protein CA2015_1689 [Cyclobacterium amurskyense]
MPKPISNQTALICTSGEIKTTRLPIVIRIQRKAKLPDPIPKARIEHISPMTRKMGPNVLANFTLDINHASKAAGRKITALPEVW